jgi:hypothetical protein
LQNNVRFHYTKAALTQAISIRYAMSSTLFVLAMFPSLAAFTILITVSLPSLGAAPYCLAGQPCFPSTRALATFNVSVGGRLFSPRPYAAVCYAGTYNAAACADLVANQMVDHYRDEIPTAAQFVQWELDDDGMGCITPPTVPPPPGITNATCVRGAQAVYVVNATNAQDVSLAVQFASRYNLRLRIKNVHVLGHVPSSRADSVNIDWT